MLLIVLELWALELLLNLLDYKKACSAGDVISGKMHIWKTSSEWIINFPTKRHWKDKSNYNDIEIGLVTLKEYLSELGNIKVAIPALGCGYGGLDWKIVSQMISDKLDNLDANISVFSPL